MLATPLQLGPVRLETSLLLAPIAGWCDLAWRMTVRELGGVGLACTDLLSPQGLLRGSLASLDIARTNDKDKPIGMQLYGSDPGILAEGALWAADHGATVVDINMGCPADKVTKKDGGSKLMCSIGSTVKLAQAVRSALPDHIPLTAKMRLGWDEQAYEAGCACELACKLTEVGVCAITVHGRTTEQLFKGQCRREGIRRVVEAVGAKTGRYTGQAGGGVPVIGNGDVRTPEDCLTMLRETGCAGVMIGRGAFAMPWIFRLAWAAQLREIGIDAPGIEPEEAEKIEVVRTYFRRILALRGELQALHKIRQKISWIGKSINGSHCRPLKDAVKAATTPDEVEAALDGWLDRAAPDPGFALTRAGV